MAFVIPPSWDRALELNASKLELIPDTSRLIVAVVLLRDCNRLVTSVRKACCASPTPITFSFTLETLPMIASRAAFTAATADSEGVSKVKVIPEV